MWKHKLCLHPLLLQVKLQVNWPAESVIVQIMATLSGVTPRTVILIKSGAQYTGTT